jgi:hypothetical protein
MNVGAMASDARPNEPPRELVASDARLAQLQEQEQLWFSWVTILHERLDKADMKGNHAVLEVARKRWLEAKEALLRYQTGN